MADALVQEHRRSLAAESIAVPKKRRVLDDDAREVRGCFEKMKM